LRAATEDGFGKKQRQSIGIQTEPWQTLTAVCTSRPEENVVICRVGQRRLGWWHIGFAGRAERLSIEFEFEHAQAGQASIVIACSVVHVHVRVRVLGYYLLFPTAMSLLALLGLSRAPGNSRKSLLER